MAQVLIILTSHDKLGDTGRDTGFYFDEMATPYWEMTDAGVEVAIASIAGGAATHDPNSVKADLADGPEPVARFLSDKDAMAKLTSTIAIDDVDPTLYDAVFLPGGHGTMYDFPNSAKLAEIVSQIYAAGGIVGAVCHGPAGLVAATKSDGMPLIAGLRLSGFTDAEEEAAGLTDAMPFLLESRLRELGARFENADNFQSHAVRDGRLVTGQNPASVKAVSNLLFEALSDRSAVATE